MPSAKASTICLGSDGLIGKEIVRIFNPFCAATYSQSIENGTACKIFLKKTNYKTLEVIPLDKLKKYAIDIS